MKINNILPMGLKVLLKRYFIFPNKKRFMKCSTIEIYPPLNVNPKFVQVENYVRIQSDVSLITSGAKLIIKKYSAIGAGCLIVPGAHVPTVGVPQFLSTLHINDVQRGIVVNEDCWIGAQAALLSKCNIGRGAVVGARSLVTKDVPPYAVVAGSPAKIIATRFTLEQIVEHERQLYPEEERLSIDVLSELFKSQYANLKAIGTNEMSEYDRIILDNEKKRIGLSVAME